MQVEPLRIDLHLVKCARPPCRAPVNVRAQGCLTPRHGPLPYVGGPKLDPVCVSAAKTVAWRLPGVSILRGIGLLQSSADMTVTHRCTSAQGRHQPVGMAVPRCVDSSDIGLLQI